MSTDLDYLDGQTGPDPTACIVVLHGLGADGNDFVPIAEQLDLRAVGPVRFVFPHAPTRPVTINNGYRMRAWYDVLGTELQRREDEAGLRASLASVTALLDDVVASGIPAERIVLMGFSQGCAMTLLTGLRYPQRLAGLVGMSGYLPLYATTAQERSAANAQTPVFLAHGTRDSVVVFQRGARSRDELQALGQPVEWHEYPIEHTVSPQEVADLNEFLLRVLG